MGKYASHPVPTTESIDQNLSVPAIMSTRERSVQRSSQKSSATASPLQSSTYGKRKTRSSQRSTRGSSDLVNCRDQDRSRLFVTVDRTHAELLVPRKYHYFPLLQTR